MTRPLPQKIGPTENGLWEMVYAKPSGSFVRHFVFFLHRRGVYSTANDPEIANDPQNGPQMILDRK